MTSDYGPLVRLWGIDPSQLPDETGTEQLQSFLAAVFKEAIPFIADVQSPASPWDPKGVKAFSHSIGPVKLYERTVSAKSLTALAQDDKLPHVDASKVQPESWFLRQSVHEDTAKKGTAKWGEFLQNFKNEHAEAEKAFTPTIVSTKLKKQWDCTDVEVEIEDDVWQDWSLKLEESVHKLPSPLNKRIFPVLQATASVRGRHDFLVVQIAAPPAAWRKPSGGAVNGVYTSIERIRDAGEGNIEWIMATASDAKGILPAWIQRLAVPDAIAKDVDMFMNWIAVERKKGNTKTTAESEAVEGQGSAETPADIPSETPAEST